MAEGPRRSTRVVKSKEDQDFVYYDENWGGLFSGISSNSDSQTRRPISESSDFSDFSTSDLVQKLNSETDQSPTVCAVLSELPLFANPSEIDEFYNISGCILPNTVNRSLQQQQNTLERPSCGSDRNVNNNKVSDRRNIATSRENFLDLQGNFFSVDSLNMSDIESRGAEGLAPICEVCGSKIEKGSCALCASVEGNPLGKVMLKTLNKVDVLAQQVYSMSNRLSRLEMNSGIDSGGEPSSQSRKHKSVKKKSKTNRVENEKYRSLPVHQENLRRQERSRNTAESGEETEEGRASGDLGRRLSPSQREVVNRRVSDAMSASGASFPDDDFDPSDGSNSNSGRDSSDSRSYRRKKKSKVKSGAEIKKRSVIKTELWPHTIINEDEGEELTSEDITLAKFFTAFTYIITTVGRVEAKGRSGLLHAVCMILDVLPWTEARTFHNVIMTKIEQGRFGWKANFADMANQFVDKKVRQTLRSKGSSGTSNRSRSDQRSYGRNNYGNNYNRNQEYAGKTLLSAFCYQWNNGTCSYGDRECKRWHACSYCAKAGKLGESHRASTHFGAGARGRQGEPRS